MKLKSQMLALVLMLLALTCLIAYTGYFAMQSIYKNLEIAHDKRLPSMNFLLQADRDLQQLLVAERTLLFSELTEEEDKKLYTEYQENYEQVITRVSKYEKLGIDEDEKALIDSFHAAREKWHQKSKALMDDRKSEDIKNLHRKSMTLSEPFEIMRDYLDKTEELILQKSEAEAVLSSETYRNSVMIQVLCFIIGGSLSLILSWIMILRISQKLSSVSHAIATTSRVNRKNSTELGNFSSSVSATVTEQAAAIHETVSTLNEISSMVVSSVKNAELVAQKADISSQICLEGKNSMESIKQNMRDIQDGIGDLGKKAETSSAGMSNIISIISTIKEKTTVINDIVTQTKLLSFNASVEAARAGEHGKGFSIVAEEVSVLAQLSGSAAKEIASILEQSLGTIKGIIEHSKKEITDSINQNSSLVEAGIEMANRGESVLSEIVEHSKTVSTYVNKITSAAKEQSDGVQNITTAMNEIEQSSGMNADAANKTAAIAEKISHSSEQLDSSALKLFEITHGTKKDKKSHKSPSKAPPVKSDQKEQSSPEDDEPFYSKSA